MRCVSRLDNSYIIIVGPIYSKDFNNNNNNNNIY